MALVTDIEEALAIYHKAAQRGVCIPAFNSENPETTLAILWAAREMGEELDIPNPPVTLSFTANYEPRSNLLNYTSVPDMYEGFLALKDDVLCLSREDGPFGQVKLMVHLDHAHPDKDLEVLKWGRGFISGVMYDCSHLSLKENMARTTDFVKHSRGQFLVEGAVDEIYEYGSGVLKNEPTDPQVAKRYMEQTGVAFIVCNLGTEHRATVAEVFYHADRAQEIRDLVGPRLVLHGTSSLKEEDLYRLAEDGIAKVNIWTRVEKSGSQALARDSLEHLPEILDQEEMSHLRDKRVITEDYYSSSQGRKPSLDYLTVAHRRNEVWMPTVVKVMKSYFRALGYERLGG